MSKQKTEIRALLFHEMGSKIEDMLENDKRELATYQGGKAALQQGQKKIEEHLKFIDKDVDEGNLTIEEATKVKKYVLHCINILGNLALTAEIQIHETRGKGIAREQLMKLTKTMYDQERAKLEAQIAAEMAPPEAESDKPSEDDGRPVGVDRLAGMHPGNPLADRREPSVKQVDVAPSPEPTSDMTTAPESAEEALALAADATTPKKKRGKKDVH